MKYYILTLSTLVLFAAKVFAVEKPNIVFIFADDLGYGDVGCYGATKVKTPNIDKLAAEGRRFTDGHSASAVCTPSRYALLTGEYPFRGNNGTGIWGPLPWEHGLIIPTETFTIGKLLQAEGYATSYFGKWHLGWGNEKKNDWSMPLESGPNQLGFDYYWGVPRVNSNSPYVYVENNMIVGYDPKDPLVRIKKGEKPTPTRIFPPDASKKSGNRFKGAVKAHELFDDEMVGTRLTGEAVKWIAKNKARPFFLLFSTTQIHHPFTPAPRFKGTSQCGLYGDFIHELDWMVGELIKSLEDNGLSDNTLVIFTSDNGGMWNRTGRDAVKAGHSINGNLLGSKFGVWEGGHRVPFIAKWPGHVPAGTESHQLICSIDMMATLAAMTGQKVDPLDSVNILPALVGNPTKPLRNELVLAASRPSHLSLRQGKWMYIPKQGSGGFAGTSLKDHAVGGAFGASFAGRVNSDIVNGKYREDAPPAQLYDMEADVSQTKNLYNEYPEVVKEMQASLETYRPTKAALPKSTPGTAAKAEPKIDVIPIGNAFPGEKTEFKGYDRYKVRAGRGNMTVICPKEAAPGKPWMWRSGMFWQAIPKFHEADLKLVEQGYHVVLAAGHVYGHPKGNAMIDAAYELLTTEYEFAKKCSMASMSRETNALFRWASTHPERVESIYVDNGVLSLRSWPGGKQVEGSTSEFKGDLKSWEGLKKAYGFTSDAEALAAKISPVDLLEPLARAGVPILSVCGSKDACCIYDEHDAILEKRYKALGGDITVIIEDKGHSHGMKDPTPVIEFIKKHKIGS